MERVGSSSGGPLFLCESRPEQQVGWRRKQHTVGGGSGWRGQLEVRREGRGGAVAGSGRKREGMRMWWVRGIDGWLWMVLWLEWLVALVSVVRQGEYRVDEC